MNKSTYILFFNFLMLFTSLNLYSQESNKGVHQMQAEEFRQNMLVSASKNNFNIPIIPLENKESNGMNKVVFGFLPDWEYNSGAHNNMRYELLTHIAVFDFMIQANGDITNPSGWPWTDVINGAHEKGTKVIMTVSNFGISDATLSTILKSTTEKNNFFDKVVNVISTYKLDGINVDFEAFNSADRGTVLNSFMAELTNHVHTELPGKEVSFDGPAVNWGGWDFAGLVDAVDHLFIMAYDYNQSKSTIADPVAPLYTGSWSKCVNETVTSSYTGYAAAISKSPEKVILGVPYYGQRWQTVDDRLYASAVAYDKSTRYKDDFDKYSTYGRQWDTNSHTPWYKYQVDGNWYEVYADDAGSLGEKYDYAITKQLGGIGIWALNFDGERDELWNLISEKFTDPPAAPTANNDDANTFQNTPVLIDILKNDTDVNNDIDKNSIDIVSGAKHGAISIDNGKITYAPDFGYFGSDEFTYTVEDSKQMISNEATVNIEIKELDCFLSASSTSNYFVRYVLFQDLSDNKLLENVTSEDGGYADYKNQILNLEVDTEYKFIGRGKYLLDNSVYPSYWKVWIDFDNDGGFDGANEELISKEGDAYAFHNFSIPDNIIPDDYTLRIATSSEPINSACGTIEKGEIEDYTVNIIGKSLSNKIEETISVSVYPNPTRGLINIDLSNKGIVTSVEVLNIHSQVVYSSIEETSTIDISNQAKGIYFVKITLESGLNGVFKVVKK